MAKKAINYTVSFHHKDGMQMSKDEFLKHCYNILDQKYKADKKPKTA